MPPQSPRDGSREIASRHARTRGCRNRALIVGVMYPDSSAELRGCGNDARNLCDFVRRAAPRAQGVDVRLLSDDPTLSREHPVHATPTRKAILDGIAWLVDNASMDTCLWFSFSGHGASVPDRGGDESDGRDEALAPSDYKRSGLITDDELHRRLVSALPPGARLTALIDACHSGTALDLRFTVDDFSVHRLGRRKERYVKEYVRNDWRRVQRTILHKNVDECDANVLMFSGCRDNQTSADAVEEGRYTGVLTHAFLRYAKNDDERGRQRRGGRTLANLLHDMSVWLRVRRYTQRPVLSYGRALNIDSALQIF